MEGETDEENKEDREEQSDVESLSYPEHLAEANSMETLENPLTTRYELGCKLARQLIC